MSLFSISDLHLSFSKIKPMDMFGSNWENHPEKIKTNWNNLIRPADTVLIPGDISWAVNLKQLAPDLAFLHDLPGTKIIVSGNHDFWWDSTAQLNDMYDDMTFLKNSYVPYGNIAICGTKGWLCPNDTYFKETDNKLYVREVNRLKRSLDMAVENGFTEIILMLHFPPTNDKKEPSGFTDLIQYYPVKKVVYGHLHSVDSFDASLKGWIDGIEYVLVSSDYLDFVPVQLM